MDLHRASPPAARLRRLAYHAQIFHRKNEFECVLRVTAIVRSVDNLENYVKQNRPAANLSHPLTDKQLFAFSYAASNRSAQGLNDIDKISSIRCMLSHWMSNSDLDGVSGV
jgi:hypothetical protein